MKPTVSVVIAAYNEDRTIGSVVNAFISWGKAREIIVVSDGSTDQTNEVVRQFGDAVRLITLKHNMGKGHALALGVQASTADILFFADADVVGLTSKNIDQLVSPILKNDADMVIGLHNFWRFGKFRPYNSLSGQRVLWKKRILPYVVAMHKARGGVEFIINYIHRRDRVIQINQSNVSTLRKIDKWPFTFAIWSYIRQFMDFIKAMFVIKLLKS